MRESSVQGIIGRKHSTGYIVKNPVVCKGAFIQVKLSPLKSGTGGQKGVKNETD